ncbi:MAG: colanic acid/amylovoran biosynthesis glycosyltransferase [Solirubrobacterales bacterium]|jgi:glycosyltransferase involved in cell wall biosynthesis|nr:colanic acid/amylovoran biosynthesis glycosyltransferase [Solirubrobacterales bacterium]
MKVAYLVSRFPVASETFVVREMNALEERGGFEIELLSLYPPKARFVHASAERWVPRAHRPSRGEAAGAVLHWLTRRPVAFLGLVGAIVRSYIRAPGLMLRALATLLLAAAHARTVERNGVDHVHAHFAGYPALAAWAGNRLTGIPYSFTAHAYDIFIEQQMLHRKVRDAAFVVAISDFNRRFLRDYGGDTETPVHVVHCGVDPAEYPFEPRTVPAAGPVRALCVAALQEKKGHAILLDAVSGAPDLERLELDLVGDGPLRPELEARAGELGLQERVRFHGSIDERAVRDLLEAADLFVLPSIIASDGQMEGIPVALMESLACGLPTVATRISGIPELIDDGRTGLLAEQGSSRDLRRVLTLLIGGQVEVDLQAARRLVEMEFDVRSSAERLAALFESGGLGGGQEDPGDGQVGAG